MAIERVLAKPLPGLQYMLSEVSLEDWPCGEEDRDCEEGNKFLAEVQKQVNPGINRFRSREKARKQLLFKLANQRFDQSERWLNNVCEEERKTDEMQQIIQRTPKRVVKERNLVAAHRKGELE